MAGLAYAAEKFLVALYGLVGPGQLQERVQRAYMSFHPVRMADFKDHPELRDAYQRLIDSLTPVEGGSAKGRVSTNLQQMSREEAARISKSIVDFWVMVQSARGTNSGSP
jgi:hypothetical protein